MKLTTTIVPLAALTLIACGSTADPSISAMTVSPAMVAAGGELTVNVTVDNFELKNPDDHGGSHGLRAAEEEGHMHGESDGDYPGEGHFHIYMDSVDENPLQLNCPDHCKHPGFAGTVRAKIPDDATAGAHKLILRLNDNGHMTLTPHIMATADFMVQ